ncbi:MAG: hypothetical protein NTX49_03420 [Chlamydiae bacterium]|nr:hypothetical protein [Chlamydiota bacterium]
MAIPTNLLYEPTRSSRTLGAEEASPLLGRKITLCYRGVGGSLNTVTTNLREIYERFQASLAESFTLTDFCIKGSCVTHLYSGEPFGDIDFHATIDLTRIAEPRERFNAGKMVNTKLVETIAKIISEKLSSATPASAVSILPTDVLFEEKHIPFSKWGKPFNIHQLHLPGSIPLEFTISAVTGVVKKPQRDYDFNSGSLKLCIEDGQVKIHSNTDDVYATLTELKKRQIYCDSPGDIENKGPERYFGKLIKSGYSDPKKELLAELIKYAESRKKKVALACATGRDATPLPSIALDIEKYFLQKGISPSAAFLSLWLLPNMKSEGGPVKDLVGEVTEILKSSFTSEANPEQSVLRSLVQDNKNKAECCWYLFMQAKSVRKVVHREEASLQLEIPSYPLFANEPSDASVFVIVPISGLERLKSTSIPKGFLDLQRDGQPLIEVKGANATDVIETKAVIQELCRSVLTYTDLYPILSTAMSRFGLESQSGFSKIFIDWVLRLSESEIEKIPLSTLVQAFKGIQEYQIDEMKQVLESKPAHILALLKRLHTLVGKEEICSFDTHVQTIVTYLAYFVLQKPRMWNDASEEDLQIMIDFGMQHIEKLCQKEKIEVYKSNGLEKFWRRILSFPYFLYFQKKVGISEMVLGGKYCLEFGSVKESLQCLQLIVEREDSLGQVEIQELMESLQEVNPLEYAKFLTKNATVIRRKMEAFPSIMEPFLGKLLTKTLSPDIIPIFLEVMDAYCGEEEKKKITKTLFINAAKQNPQSVLLLEQVSIHRNLSCKDFDWISEMDADQIQLLSKQSGFALLLASDPDFITAIIDRAILVRNFDLVTLASLQQAKTRPEECLRSLEVLNRSSIDPTDLTMLPARIKILGQLLKSHPGFIENTKSRSLIEAVLTNLSMYLTTSEGGPVRVLDEEFFSALQEFHKNTALYTLDNPTWPQIWKTLHASGRNKAIKDWINPEDLAKTLATTNPTGNILKLIDTFDLDGSFIYELIRQVRNLSKDSYPAFTALIQGLLQKGNHLLLESVSLETSTETEDLASFVINTFYNSIQGSDKRILDSYAFLALSYNRPEKIERLLSIFDSIYAGKTSSTPLFENSTLPLQILFFFAKRSMIRKDITIFKITASYKAWGSKKVAHESFIDAEVDLLSFQLRKLFEGSFSDSIEDMAPIEEKRPISVFEFYSLFLVDIIKRSTVDLGRSLATGEIGRKGVNLAAVIELINYINKKKLIKLIPFLTPLVVEIQKLEPKQQQEFAIRFIGQATEMLMEIERKPIEQTPLLAFSNLLNYVNGLVNSAESSSKKKIPRSGIKAILDCAWHIIPNFKGTEEGIHNALTSIFTLEANLSKDEIESYHSSRAESIISRKGSVKLAELNGWIRLTLLLDPRFSSGMDGGAFVEEFKGKIFINSTYLNTESRLKPFLGILDLGIEKLCNLAFEKKSDVITEVDVNDILTVNIFNFLDCYFDEIASGISEMQLAKNKSAGIALDKFYRGVLEKYLKLPKSICEIIPLMSLSSRIIIHRTNGSFDLIRIREFSDRDLFQSLYLMIRNLPLLTVKEGKLYNLLVKSIAEVYAKNKSAIEKVLKPEEVEEINCVLSQLIPAAVALGVSGGAGSSVRRV